MTMRINKICPLSVVRCQLLQPRFHQVGPPPERSLWTEGMRLTSAFSKLVLAAMAEHPLFWIQRTTDHGQRTAARYFSLAPLATSSLNVTRTGRPCSPP